MSKYTFEQLTKSTRQAITTVTSRAESDEAFRKRLVRNPAQTIKQETGVVLDPGFSIAFVDGQDLDYVHVLPPMNNEEEELGIDELDAVAGGTGDDGGYTGGGSGGGGKGG